MAAGTGLLHTHSEYTARYGAAAADLKKVEDYCTSQGLTVESSDKARRTVRVSGSLSKANQAFGAELHLFQSGQHQFRARTGKLHIPADLQGIVIGIFGFDQRPQARPHLRRNTNPNAAATSFSPLDVAEAYLFPPGDGTGQTIGIIELGGGYQSSDLKTFFSGIGITPVPGLKSVGVDGAKNSPSGDPNSADAEVELDIEVAGAIAPKAAIVVYFAPNTTQGFLDAITTAIHDTTHSPSVISISWGGPEDTHTGQALTAYDEAFQDAKALGVTVCVASGDSGSSDGESDGNAHVDFPASSPNVLACGGTTLHVSTSKGMEKLKSETVWNGGSEGGATGGGVSETFPVPDYQADAKVPVSVNSSHFAGRGVPDVAGNADPSTGYNVVVDGQQAVIGGTSAVAPLWAGLIARINQTRGSNLGFSNPAFYAIRSKAFHDISKGNNGDYSARKGWDACTGLGSPEGTKLLAALQSTAPTT